MDYSGKIIKKTPVVPSQTSASGVWSLDEALQATKSNTWPVANVPDPISRSLRLRASASAYLNRTPTAAGNLRTWTWSGWVKRGLNSLADDRYLFSATNGGTTVAGIFYNGGSDTLRIAHYNGSTNVINLNTTALYRDFSSWYHIVAVFDTTQATSSDRVKLYVNGVQVTAFQTAVYPSQNFDSYVNQTTVHKIGAQAASSAGFFDGYMTEVYLIDGQALTPSSFGGTNAVTGVWEPRPYTGTYGTNGFLLTFSDNTSTTTLGNDTSGNSNNWTTNNISLTAGSTYDSMLDVPTQWIGYNTGDVASVTRGNYCTLNPLWFTDSGAGTLSNANLNFTQGAGVVYGNTFGTMGLPPIGTAGKYYYECVFTSGILTDINQGVGIWNSSSTADYAGVWPKSSSSVTIRSGSQTATGVAYSHNTIVQVAVDCATGSIWFGFNNSWISGSPSAGTSPTYNNLTSGAVYVPGVSTYSYSTSGFVNFGQRPFSYTPPAGFLSLCTTNLPSPTILQGDDYFNALLYTGNGSTQTITGLDFQPDWVWIKNRSNSVSHCITDAVRGTNLQLASNSLAGDQSTTDGITAFNSNGFSLGAGTQQYSSNTNTQTYVAWNWKANGAGGSNTAGSITSTASASTASGFSIVTYTGTGSNATVGHGIGTAPRMVIVKRRNGSTNWPVFHSNAGNEAVGFLNTTDAFSSPETTYWNATSPTSTVFSIGTNAAVNGSGNTYLAYVFAEVAGYSSIGRYTGNGSADGTFVYTGFRPRYIMIKNRDSAGFDWILMDTARDPGNVATQELYADLSLAEGTAANNLDILSNGFKIRRNNAAVNTNGGAYLYMAFAQNPFKNALAR